VLDYAVSTSQTSAEVPDALFAQLRARFDDAHLVKLTYIIALANLRGR
jgi:alkylhydroperoxidase family enzyme